MQRPPRQFRPMPSASEAARTIGINKSTLSRQVDSGAIRSYQGKVVISEVIEDRKQSEPVPKQAGKFKPPASTKPAARAGGRWISASNQECSTPATAEQSLWFAA
jgi:hypothetical protein